MAITNKHIIDQNRTIHLWANHGVWAKYGKFILVYKSNSIYIYIHVWNDDGVGYITNENRV